MIYILAEMLQQLVIRQYFMYVMLFFCVQMRQSMQKLTIKITEKMQECKMKLDVGLCCAFLSLPPWANRNCCFQDPLSSLPIFSWITSNLLFLRSISHTVCRHCTELKSLWGSVHPALKKSLNPLCAISAKTISVLSVEAAHLPQILLTRLFDTAV